MGRKDHSRTWLEDKKKARDKRLGPDRGIILID